MYENPINIITSKISDIIEVHYYEDVIYKHDNPSCIRAFLKQKFNSGV